MEKDEMSIEKAKAYLKQFDLDERVMELEQSSATVELAAKALGCEPDRIAKTLSFIVEDAPILIVVSGMSKIDNHKYKEYFKTKAKMIEFENVEERIGHAPGGVCPFGVNPQVTTYLDVSLKKYETVFPAAGSGNSAIELTIPELEQASGMKEWVDVCK
jgi:prolyl-tRNA editing enzyme YbaK/EbsC (Cys-tRNA(Pro) deacylase)